MSTGKPLIIRKDQLQQALERLDLAKHVYRHGEDTPAGWRILASSAADETKVSGFFSRVYEKTGPVKAGEAKYVIAFCGTDSIFDLEDLKSNLEIGLKRVPEQYWDAVRFVNQICEEKNISHSEIELTGHSLGGYLARTVGLAINARMMWTFDSPGATELEREAIAGFVLQAETLPDRLVQVRSAYDIVSKWGYDAGTVIEIKTETKHHSLTALRQGLCAVIEGKEITPLKKDWKDTSFSEAFNVAVRRLNESEFFRFGIKTIFEYTDKKDQLKPA